MPTPHASHHSHLRVWSDERHAAIVFDKAAKSLFDHASAGLPNRLPRKRARSASVSSGRRSASVSQVTTATSCTDAPCSLPATAAAEGGIAAATAAITRSEEHTSELQSLMRIS